jgi:hypothetical protein
MMVDRILYTTFDGVLQPLAFSQVVRVVTGLARRGLPYALLSVERRDDLEHEDRVQHVEDILRAADIPWTRIDTDLSHSLRRSGSALARASRAALRLASTQHIALVHARSYQAAALAYSLRSLLRIPYLFDVRGCWIDERSGPGDWFSDAWSYGAGKFVEHKLLASASAVVTLTELQASDIRSTALQANRRIDVIPTCTDYAAFPLRASRPHKPEHSSVVPESIRQMLKDKLVLGLVGSFNRWYLTDRALALAKFVMEESPNTHLVILSRQVDEYMELAHRTGFPMDRLTIATCAHHEVPEWLQWLDWGLLLLQDNAAKRGSMPTKLAEFFATGVRPIAFGCNSEVGAWVRRAGSGCMLESLDDAALRQAATIVAQPTTDFAILQKARLLTEPHFGLRAGLDRYEALLKALLPKTGAKPFDPPRTNTADSCRSECS